MPQWESGSRGTLHTPTGWRGDSLPSTSHLQDMKEAVYWFRKAASEAHSGAQNNLGVCYENAKGVPQDVAEAVKWCVVLARVLRVAGGVRAVVRERACGWAGADLHLRSAQVHACGRERAQQGAVQSRDVLRKWQGHQAGHGERCSVVHQSGQQQAPEGGQQLGRVLSGAPLPSADVCELRAWPRTASKRPSPSRWGALLCV